MFTGIITEVGTIRSAARQAQGLNLTIAAPKTAPRLRIGDSIAVHGVCLTAERTEGDAFVASVMAETASKTTLGKLRPGARVNLELPMTLNDFIGGHLVAGHVDAVGSMTAREQRGDSILLTILAPSAVQPYIAPRGSVAVDGVSLTVAEVNGAAFAVSLVRHTLEATTLGDLRPGDEVNLEGDLLARYLERLLEFREGRSESATDIEGLTLDKLGEGGYL
jgi:riboflavin synthase